MALPVALLLFHFSSRRLPSGPKFSDIQPELRALYLWMWIGHIRKVKSEKIMTKNSDLLLFKDTISTGLRIEKAHHIQWACLVLFAVQILNT